MLDDSRNVLMPPWRAPAREVRLSESLQMRRELLRRRVLPKLGEPIRHSPDWKRFRLRLRYALAGFVYAVEALCYQPFEP